MDQAYRDAYGCRHSGMPLGGIGAGSLEVRPDGHFYRWHLMNNRPWGSGPATTAMEAYGLRFGLCYDLGDGPRCLALEEHLGLDPGLDGWFWFSDPYHLPWVRHADAIDYTARLPFAELAYRYTDVPLEIRLTAWSPFIPGDAAASNTPGAVLTFRITNQADTRCTLSLFGLLKNAVGYDHPELVSSITLTQAGPAGIVCTRAGLDAAANSQGTLGLFAEADVPAETTYAIHPRHGRDLWDALLQDGRLENMDYAEESTGGPVGEIGAETKLNGPRGMQRAALGLELALEPGETAQVTFYLTWHFPNFTEQDARGHAGTCIGVQYANRFGSAMDVAGWLARERGDLEARTRAFADGLYSSTLPAWELRAIAAGFSVLYRAAWWDRTGRFGVWEGIGCCGLQTIDVGHYSSLPILQMFPELDASQNRLSAANLEPNGKVPHLMPGNFTHGEVSGNGRGRIDLGAQYVLAVWRHALWTGRVEEARAVWPVIEGNLAWLAGTDANGDGLPDNQGPDQTYDRFPLYGTSAFVGFLYLGALRAAADLATWLGEADAATRYTAMAERAAGELERQLWNGGYYNLSHDPVAGTSNTGCMTDQVNGDWFFRQSTGRGLLPDARVREALGAIFRINRRTAGTRAWLPNCTWPQGGGVTITRRGSDQANCPWSGVEYALAAHMVLLGEREMGRQVAQDVFQRYEDAGMRYNHAECGEFYYRAMSVWALYQAEFGIAYDAMAARLLVAPERDAAFLVIVPGGMAQATWEETARTLTLVGLSGNLPLREVVVSGIQGDLTPVTLTAGDTVRVALPAPVGSR